MSELAPPPWDRLSPSTQQALGFAAALAHQRTEADDGLPATSAAGLVSDLDLLVALSEVHGRRNQLRTICDHFEVSWDDIATRIAPHASHGMRAESLRGLPPLDAGAVSTLASAAQLAARGDPSMPVRVRHVLGALLSAGSTPDLLARSLAGRLDAGGFDRLVRLYVDDYLAKPDADLAAMLASAFPPDASAPREPDTGVLPVPSGRVWVFYADAADERQVGALSSGASTTWGANEHARRGDLALVYLTAPVSAIGYVVQAVSDAFEPSDERWPWPHAVEVQPIGALSAPLTLDLIRTHPALAGWRFAGTQQGAMRWTDDIRAQGFWPPVRGLVVATNPHLAASFATWEGVAEDEITVSARSIAEQIPDEAARELALRRLAGRVDTTNPEPKVARDYWTVDDRLGVRPYAEAIAAFIRHRDTAPPLTIGIKAPWGAGKSSLMRMVQAELDPPIDRGSPVWRFTGLKLTAAAKHQLVLTASDDGTSQQPVATPKPTAGERSTERLSVGTALDRSRRAPNEPIRLDKVPEAVSLEQAPAGSVAATRWRATVWFNPWMYQTGEEVWAGFAHEIIEQITGRLSLADRERFWLELNLRRLDRQAVRRRIYTVLVEKLVPMLVVWAVATIGFLVAGLDRRVLGSGSVAMLGAIGVLARQLAFGQKVGDTISALVRPPDLAAIRSELRGSMEGALDDVLPDPGYQSRTGFLHLVQTDIRHVLDLVASKDRPLVIFVDDLDRCSPGVVAQTIEAINLFLAGQFPNVVFVLAMEPAVVAAHVEVAHHDLIERLRRDPLNDNWSTLGWRFLEKIVQLPLSLPQPSRRQAGEYLASLFATAEPTGPTVAAQPERTVEQRRVEAGKRALDHSSLADLPEQGGAIDETVRAQVIAEAFEEKFSDADPFVQEIVRDRAMELPYRNAREMKRLLNLFRFYAFIARRNPEIDMSTPEAQREALQRVARLAVLAIRWPYLLNVVARPTSPSADAGESDRPSILLEDLERAAADDAEWESVLLTARLATEDGDPPKVHLEDWAAELRTFCRGQPAIGRFARDFM